MSQQPPPPSTMSKSLSQTFTLQDLCNQYDGQYVVCRLPHTTTIWTKALVITTIPPRKQDGDGEWEFVLFTQEDSWRHLLRAKPTKKKTAEEGGSITFDSIRIWTPEVNLDDLNKQQSDLEVIQSAEQYDKRGRLVPGTRFDNHQTEFFTQQYEKAVASLRKSLQTILFDYVKDERKEAERLLAEGKIRKKRCNDRLRFDLQRQTRIGAIEKQLVELGGNTGRWSIAEHDAFIKVWLRMRHPPRKSYGERMVVEVVNVSTKQPIPFTDMEEPLSSAVDAVIPSSQQIKKDNSVEFTTETSLGLEESDGNTKHMEKKVQPEVQNGMADLWSHPSQPSAVKEDTTIIADNANDTLVVDGEDGNAQKAEILTTNAIPLPASSTKPTESNPPILLDPPILFTISKSQRSLLLRNLPVNCPGKSKTEFNEHIDWYLQYLGLTVEKKKLMLWWEKEESPERTIPSSPGHPRSTSPSPVVHTIPKGSHGDPLSNVRPKEKEGVGYAPFAPARGHWGNDRGQLFDAHGPSFTTKAKQSSIHTSKGHMTDNNTGEANHTTTNEHTKKGMEEEIARKKLLLWREMKEKEMQAALKEQQLLVQKEKTERLRFLHEQQRKREQIKLWRDAEIQLKNEREIAERQARQIVDVVKSRATSASLKRPEDSIPWGDEWVLFTKDESWRYSVLADTIKKQPPQQPPQQQQPKDRLHGERSSSPVGKSTSMGISNNMNKSKDTGSPDVLTRVRVESPGKGNDREDSPMRNNNPSRGGMGHTHLSSTHISASKPSASTHPSSAADGLRWIDLFPPEVIPITTTTTTTTTTTSMTKKSTSTMVPAIASSSAIAAKPDDMATVTTSLPAVHGVKNGKSIVRPQSAHPLLRNPTDKILADNHHHKNATITNATITGTTTRGRSLSPTERQEAQDRLYRNTSHGTSHSSTTTAKGLVFPSSGVISSATLNFEPNGEEFISWGGGVAVPPLPISGINPLDETTPVKPRQVHPSIFFAQHRMELNAETTQRRIQAIEARKKQLRPRHEVLKEVEANVDFSYVKRDVNRLLQPTATVGNRQMASSQPQPQPPISAAASKGTQKQRPKSASTTTKPPKCVVLH